VSTDGGLSESRFHPCTLFDAHSVRYALWLEDLLSLYGSDVLLWDLQLLVKDLDLSAVLLEGHGYSEIAPDAGFMFIPHAMRGCRFQARKLGNVVNLLPSDAWLGRGPGAVAPTLSTFLNAVMKLWLDIPYSTYAGRIEYGRYLVGLIAESYRLVDTNGVAVRKEGYGRFLYPKYREVHAFIINTLARQVKGLSSVENHAASAQRAREIREGLLMLTI
jgi:hypothetical protein